jgi:hypothetical protein
MKIFDYFTVQAPHDDYLPNAPAEVLFPPPPAVPPPSQPVANADPAHVNGFNFDDFERTVGVHGLININTAPWRVLAAVPWARLPQYTGGTWGWTPDPTINANLARAIVNYRDQHGPFRNLFDLYQVPEIRFVVGGNLKPIDPFTGQLIATPQPGIIGTAMLAPDGKLTPNIGANDNFENQYLFLNRVSNLLTTRSDTFTCYLVVEGWRNAGTANPQRVAQRRSAFILDRTGVTPYQSDKPPLFTGIRTVTFPND